MTAAIGLRRARQGARASWHRAVSEYRALMLLLLLALLLRLPLVLLTPGYDVRDYMAWTRTIDRVGVTAMYSYPYPDSVPGYNYPPLYLYTLQPIGTLYAALRPYPASWKTQLLAALVKIPPVIAELILGCVLYRFLSRRSTSLLAFVATAAYLLNPAIIWDTAYWGGIDALHALFLTAALFAVADSKPVRAWSLATLAVGFKLLAVPGALVTLLVALRREKI